MDDVESQDERHYRWGSLPHRLRLTSSGFLWECLKQNIIKTSQQLSTGLFLKHIAKKQNPTENQNNPKRKPMKQT